jgi:murein DD-endopeptidase MepM/ murein hydrolase activator NlpD
MSFGRVKRLARRLLDRFPERHIAIRSNGQVREVVLTPERQLAMAGLAAAGVAWMVVATVVIAAGAVSRANSTSSVAQTQAKYERWIADRQARLNSALAQLNSPSRSMDALANSLEKRNIALAMLLTDARGASGVGDAPAANLAARSPAERIAAARLDQEQLIETAGSYAKSRADRLRMAFRLAGLDPNLYAGRGDGLGGPLIDAKDPRALGAVLDVDEDFARRIQRAAIDLSDARGLTKATQTLPLARPADNVTESSGFGARLDPFTDQPAFHSGQDFAGAFMTPVHATAPGIVSFAGIRSGYGNTVEIDHGQGFKTRYAHLESIAVNVGQQVALGQRIGGMGSTGRSTGDHLHYEVWVNGRPQNPLRFVKAGDYVQQTQ